MTTNIMFLRDMKTTTKQGMNIKQGLAKAMLLVLLFLVGGMVNEAWADTYTYRVINNRGTIATHYTVTDATAGSAPSLPNIIRSPLLADDDYQYYAESSVTVSNGTYTVNSDATPITTLPASGATIYVRYTYTQGNGAISLDLTGATTYYIKATDPLAYNVNNSQQREVYLVNEHEDLFSNLDGTIWGSAQWWPEKFMSSKDGATRRGYLWHLEGEDPYDIYIKSDYTPKNKTAGYVGGDDASPPALAFYNKGGSGTNNGKDIYSYFLNAEGFLVVGNDKNSNDYLFRIGKKFSSHGGRAASWERTANNDYHPLYNFKFIAVPAFKFCVKTHVTGTTLSVVNEDAVTMSSSLQIPDKLKRKYCNYTFYLNYDEESGTYSNPVTTYQQVVDGIGSTSDDYTIYVDYTVDESAMPFELGTSYDDAAWYRLYENNTGKYIYSNNNNTGKLAKGNDNTYTAVYMFAFVGDPYELRIYNMQNGSGRYLSVDTKTNESQYNNYAPEFNTRAQGYWELYDDGFTDDATHKYFALRLFNTNIAYPLTSNDNPLQISNNKNVAKFSVAEGKKFNYTFKIVDKQGRIAMQYTTKMAMSMGLNYNRIPEAIRSEYLKDETLNFYTDYNTKSDDPLADGRYKYTFNNNKRTTVAPTPTNIDTQGDTPIDIYVTYSTNHLAEKDLHLRGVRAFSMNVGSEYAYANNSTTLQKSATDSKENNLYWWHVIGGDPYAVQIQNVGATSNQYFNISVNTSTTPPVTQSMGDNTGLTSYVVLMNSSQADDANQTITMGVLPVSNENTVYTDSTASYLRTTNINLVSRKRDVTYYLIDRSGKLLLKSGPVASDEPKIPDDIRSPFLDDSQYHYYDITQVTETSGTYTAPNGTIIAGKTYLQSATDATSSIIYVFYDACTSLTFSGDASGNVEANRDQMYLLRYHNGVDFIQEDGKDGFDASASTPVYPYNNGEANLYIYSQERLDLQMGQGASTRARWAWYIESAGHDPYHVKLTSHQNQTATNSINHHAYLRSYTPVGYDKIVTGVITNNPKTTAESSSDWNTTKYGTAPTSYVGGSHDNVPTEYMLIGTSAEEVKLITTYILSGSTSNKTTYGTTATDYDVANHYTVHSFEQYWKNNPTVLNLVYELNGATTDSEKKTIQTRLNASGLTNAEKRMLRNRGWHSYNAWANIANWTTTSGKTYQYTDHWFETIEMGETFNFEPFTVTPAVILIDQHGWEIMRCSQSDLETLKKFDSPMVKAYHWWSDSKKVPGYHKYTVEGTTVPLYEVRSDGKWYATGEEYTLPTTTTLADVPYRNLSTYQGYGLSGDQYTYTSGKTVGPKDDRKVDLYVTYEVKDEYRTSYVGGASEGAAQPSEFLVRQGANYAVAENMTDIATSTTPGTELAAGNIGNITDAMKWYLKPNFYIDREMGYLYSGETGAQESAKTLEETEADNYASTDNGVADAVNGRNGFDPYNLQVQNVAYGTYLTTSLTSTTVDNKGCLTGTYGGGNTLTLTDGTAVVHAVGHDQVDLRITNTVFMAVQDANGNMRLMPRFDHNHVVANFGKDNGSDPAAATVEPAAAQPANDQAHNQTTLLQIPKVFTYIVIDNQKREALRFQSTNGEVKPTMKPRFTSPFAKDFKFYEEATLEGSTYTINTTDTIASTSRLQGNEATIYVRYGYDYKADNMAVLSGGHFKMTINNSEVGLVNNYIKSSTSEEYKWFSSAKATINPDPYAMQIFNNDELTTPISITVSETEYNRFIVLPFTDSSTGEYSLVVPTSGTFDYKFVDGNDLATGATISQQDDYTTATYTAETPRDSKYKVVFSPRIPTEVTYKIITHTGKVALTGTVSLTELDGNYVASLPAWMATPIMKSSAYRYYAKATTSADVTTVDPDYETHSVLNLESGDIVYVRYDYNEDTRQAVYTGRDGINGPYILDLSGKQSYLLSSYCRYYRDNNLTESGDRTIAITDNNGDGMNITAPLSTRPLWLLKGNDPYEITIHNKHFGPNDKKIYAKTPTSSDKDAKETTYATPLKVYTATEASTNNYNYSTFMLLPARFYQTTGGDAHDDLHPALIVTGNEYLAVSRPDNKTDKMYVYQRTENQKTRATHTTAGSIPGHMRFEFVPIVEYHIITNEGNEALTVWSNYSRTNTGQTNNRCKITSDNTVTLPKFAQSPLLNESDFRYFATKPVWNSETETLTEEVTTTVDDEVIVTNAIESGENFDDLLSIDSYTGGDIYVRYTYDRSTSPLKVGTLDAYLNDDDSANDGLDLSGDTWYNLADMFRGTNNGVGNTGGFLYTTSNDNFGYTGMLGVGTKSGFTSLSAKNLLWKLVGNDPYAIRILNSYKGDNVQLTIPASGNAKWENASTATNPFQTFMYMNAFANDERGGQAAGYPYWHMLMATGSGSASQYTPLTGNGNENNNFAAGISATTFTEVRNDMMFVSGNRGNYYVAFFRANVTRRYRFHAMNCITGSPVEAWTATIEHEWLKPVVLEDAIARRYAWYETKSSAYSNAADYDAGDVANTIVTPTNTFDTRENLSDEAQFYHNEEMTERIYYKDNNTTWYDYYPEIDENGIYDIYFKYKPMTNDEIETNYPNDPFRFATATQVSADVATYATNGRLESGTIQTPWFFMVLDTDADMTVTGEAGSRTFTGKQYFLRREDEGGVSWMNNDYALHNSTIDNYKNWTCHRLAEWYKKGDNEAYREGRWLWAFLGDDPYNLKLLNMETAVGVTASTQGVYTLDAADNCYTTITSVTNDKTGKTTYPVKIPTEEPNASTDMFTWGITNGYGSERTLRLVNSQTTTTTGGVISNNMLYWQMGTDSVECNTYVSANRTQAIQLIKYVPVQYQDINLVIKRDDHVDNYIAWKTSEGTSATDNQKRTQIQSYDSGLSLLYFTADERSYCAGDQIDMRDDKTLPLNVRRAFCDYTIYKDDYATTVDKEDENTWYYTVTDGPYPDKSIQATTNGSWTSGGDNADDTYTASGDPVYDEDGRPVYPYYTIDAYGHKRGADGGAQSLYVKYKVTSDIFLKTAPTKTEVENMRNNNDHVFFMDFPTYDSKGIEITHHAFYDNEATFRIQTGDLSQKKDANTGIWRTEKKKWDGSAFVDNYSDAYNNCQFRTSNDRMTSVPEDLKWYFVGDPYKVQVYNTAGEWNTSAITDRNSNIWAAETKAANLARFNPVETNFQFVVDCVHMQMPDYTNIDNRDLVYPTDSLGNALDPIANRNKGKPYFNDFYWEVVPTVSTDPDAFALRFKEDNDLMGYRNVYYYLAHDGLTKRYVTVGESDKQTYHINLSYDPTNSRRESGTYLGYHTSNNNNTVIRLVQPVKVYITATKDGTAVVTDELSEYYGLDEMLDGVPRHLQRKFVSYDAMQHELTAENATSKGTCDVSSPTDPTHPASYVKLDPTTKGEVTTYKNIVFKYNVGYAVNDITSAGVHLFSPAANPSSPTAAELANVQWLDMMVGLDNDNSQKHWAYYDKLNGDENQTSLVSDYRRAMSSNKATGWTNDVNGWSDGLKGLHWAFIGDPYDFTILNRRRYEDGTPSTDPMWLTVTKATIPDFKATEPNDSVIWTTSMVTTPTATNTSTATAALSNGDPVSHFSVQMWKLGGDDDYFLRTASLKSTTNDYYNAYGDNYGHINQTNNYWRMVAKTYTASTPYSFFEMVPYSLSDKSRLTNNQNTLNYNNYVTNGYGYSTTMSGLGAMQQRLIIRTAVAKDEDKADNDCFDTEVRVYSNTHVLRIKKRGMEIKYGDITETMPYTLRRYGCTYECYLVTDNDSVKITDFDATTALTSTDANINGQTFRQFIDSKPAASDYHISYVYRMTDEASAYFTSASDALTEDYTWINSYFAWNQKYSGTYVEVEYYEKVFDHYVYNEQGQVIDEVYRTVRKTRVVQNPTEAYPTTAYLNSHTNQTNIYADEGTQSENDRQKWSLIGDPYEFTMKNYAQYLVNQNAILTLQSSSVNNSVINAEAQNFAIGIDKSGNAYLSVIDENGEVITNISFDFSTSSDKHLKTVGSGTNQNDPTGNTYDVSNVKPFVLTNLLSYADIVQYHLVIAHQHSLDPTETYLDLSKADDDSYITAAIGNDATKTANRSLFKEHLLEYLMYQGIQKGTKNMYVNLDGDNPASYKSNMESDIKTLLKQNASLRDFISYPIADYSVARVGIGNHPQVPWYMKRQFCRYYLYQKDVQRSATDYTSPALEEADADWTGATVRINGTLYKVDPSSSYKIDVVLYEGKIYLQGNAPGTGTTYENVVQRTFVEDGVTKKAFNATWKSIFDKESWTEWDSDSGTEDKDYETVNGTKRKIPSGYAQALALQGKVLDRLQDCHYNRKVLIDVVYEVIPEVFQFAYRGRNTTAWYQMMTNNSADGLMNFSYKAGIGARQDRREHYTNDYLWAPEGDPYGFVLRSRYATINGNGWDNVAVTTKGALPKASDYSSYSELSEENYLANYTDHTQFDDKRIIHKLSGQEGSTSDGPTNAVYEMFTGDAAFTNSFLMHPTSAYLDNTDSNFESYYMIHDTSDHLTKLTKASGRTLQENADANWTLRATPEQLLPYFERAGYVGGIKPEKAVSDFNYQDYYTTLQNAVTNGTAVDFATLRKIQEIVYAGTFKDADGATVAEGTARSSVKRPMTFESTNLVNMTDGYYRIAGFSTDKLNAAETSTGIQGPRYVSGYRFASELDRSKPLRFFETTKDDATIHTFADLITAKGFSDATPGTTVLQGNIELLPADFDPSSIFKFASSGTSAYGKYTLSTQGLNVQAAAEGNVTMSSSDGTALRLDDIGGAAVTLRYFNGEPADWDANVVNNIKTNYLTSTGDSYSISMTANNEMNETSNIQDTKWLLQPVGIHEDWPYNEMPLRVEVQKGGVNSSGNEDPYYYGSLYVPFDTRLGNTTDAAFTLTSTISNNPEPTSITMASVSRLNEMGNPQFVPANWPVVIRTNSAGSITLVNQGHTEDDPNVYTTKHYVNMYIPNLTPTVIANAIDGTKEIKLSGQYLEQTLTTDKHVMVFGLPFVGLESHSSHEYDNTKQVGWYTNDNWEREEAPTKKAHIGSYPDSGDDYLVATHSERDNKYVYHNKVYYLHTLPESPVKKMSYVIAIFDGDELLEDTDNPENSEDSENSDSTEKTTPWPCDVFDLQGRRVAVNETPETLRRNHPGLPKGVYIFGHKKVIVK